MLSLLGFGKRRRTSKKSKKSKSAKGRKPDSRLLKICKRLKIKVTLKRGSKRVYKSTRVLKKATVKKLRLIKKKKLLQKKKLQKKKKSSRRSRIGSRRVKRSSMKTMSEMEFGRHRRRAAFGNCAYSKPMNMVSFGRRKAKSVKSRAAAMKAFKAFYRRHCRSSAMGRRMRFGSGGNPALSNSMGYEFCPSGMGGVLGATSTGLFPSPCGPMNTAQAAAEAAVQLPDYSNTPMATTMASTMAPTMAATMAPTMAATAEATNATAFGYRRPYKARRKCYGKGKSRYCLKAKPKRSELYYRRRRV
jgi:hypothetical protein